MLIKVNGEPLELAQPLSMQALITHLKLNPTQVAIERNREIVPRSLHGDVLAQDGDAIEIVRFIGGG